MQIVRTIAGFSMGRADEVRRAMSKKKAKEMQRARQSFIYGEDNDNGTIRFKGCVRNGIDEKTAESIFDDMDAFAQYAFNKSHAAAYSFVTYQTAYLKCLYPAQFMAALISSVMDDSNKVAVYINNAQQNKIPILPPDINKSDDGFTVENGGIRFGLTTIKNVGESFVRKCVSERNKNGSFKSLKVFISRMLGELNKRSVECLIKSGAFDSLEGSRAQKLAVYEEIIDSESRAGKNNLAGQISFFGTEEDKGDIFPAKVHEYSKQELLQMEKEVAGIYMSGHPLDEFRDRIQKLHYANCAQLLAAESGESEYKDGSEVTVSGIISKKREKLTKSNTNMAFITLEDFTGSIEVIVFPKILSNYDSMLSENSIVIMHGRVDVKEDENVKLILDSVSPFSVSEHDLSIELFGDNIYKLDKIRQELINHSGQSRVFIKCDLGNIETNLFSDASKQLITKIDAICGYNAAKLL